MVTAEACAPGSVSAQVAEVELALHALVTAPAVVELAATEVVRLLALRALLATAISDRLSLVEAGAGPGTVRSPQRRGCADRLSSAAPKPARSCGWPAGSGTCRWSTPPCLTPSSAPNTPRSSPRT